MCWLTNGLIVYILLFDIKCLFYNKKKKYITIYIKCQKRYIQFNILFPYVLFLNIC